MCLKSGEAMHATNLILLKLYSDGHCIQWVALQSFVTYNACCVFICQPVGKPWSISRTSAFLFTRISPYSIQLHVCNTAIDISTIPVHVPCMWDILKILWVCLHYWVESWVDFFLISPYIAQFIGCVIGRIHYGLKVVFCLRHFTASHYYHDAGLLTGVEHM